MTLQQGNPEETTFAELPASILAAAQRLRATSTSVRAHGSLQPITRLQTVSMAAFAALLARYGLKAELEAADGELSVRMCRREGSQVAP